MKKILLLGLLILCFQNSVVANETTQPLTHSEVSVFSEEEKFGLKDKKGNIIAEAEYKKCIRLGNTSWIIQKGNKYGLMNSDGEIIIKPKYRHADRLFGRLVKLGNDKDFGIYDEFGNVVIPAQYAKIDPLFGKMFLTYKNYRYGISDFGGKILLENKYDDIYMPTPKQMRIKYEGEWYEIEKLADNEIILPENVTKITVNDVDYKVTHLIANTGVLTGYSALTATDYFIKIFSSISPAYEETIDELMLSHGTDMISIFPSLLWLPKFPFTYAKKYYNILVPINNGPLSDVRTDLKKQLK